MEYEMNNLDNTPRCDELAREHMRLRDMGGTSQNPGIVPDWIALAQTLERELAEARRALAGIVRITDRDHVAWDAARAVLANG